MSAKFNLPYGVAVDNGENLFVSDYGNARIRRIDWITRSVTTVAGNGVQAELDGIGTAAQFSSPNSMTIFNGSIWVTDIGGGTVRHIGRMHCFSSL